MRDQRKHTQRHLLECYLLLRDFTIMPASTTEHLQLMKKPDVRVFHLKVTAEWLKVPSSATVEQRLSALELVPFLEKNGSAWIGLTRTGQEVIRHGDEIRNGND